MTDTPLRSPTTSPSLWTRLVPNEPRCSVRSAGKILLVSRWMRASIPIPMEATNESCEQATDVDRCRRDGARDFLRIDHCNAHSHVSVSISQHSVRIDGTDIARRRLSVCVEVQLWLQPLFL